MPRGGTRKGAGRKKGTPNTVTAEERLLAKARAAPTFAKLVELVQGARSEAVQLGAIREHLNREVGRARAGDEPQAIVKIERSYRWARTPQEATLDPARPKPKAARRNAKR